MSFYCNSSRVRKYGLINGKQRYKCHDCNRQFLGGSRLNAPELWDKYVYGKQTYAQLAIKYSCSVKTIQRKN